jgi:predicted GNAT family acetyltransferase
VVADPSPTEFLVDRRDLRRFAFRPAVAAHAIDLQPGHVVLRLDRFGLSANNVTYAVLGESMRYWEFFPAPGEWGRIPVWGYADVVRSAHDEIREGERAFGYLPISTYAVVQPERVSAGGFVDGAPHRAGLPPVYQRYSRVTGSPGSTPEEEDLQALWRPLFMTSFGAAEHLLEHDLFGAQAVVLSSASSKTALGIAFLLSRRSPSQAELIGLTSPANLEFCKRVGYYDRVLAYGEARELSPEWPSMLVDLAGDPTLLGELRAHLGESLRHVCIVGATHWEEREPGRGLVPDGAQFFFLPPWLEERRREWGPGELGRRYGEAWEAFLPSAATWLRVVRGAGPAAVEAVYRELLEGRTDPAVGHVLSLAPGRGAAGVESTGAGGEELAIVDEPERSRYELRVGASLAGFTDYHLQPGLLTLLHTQLDRGFEGRGLGSRFAAGVLDDVRRRGLRVHPVCPFVRAFIRRHPEYADLVAFG